MHSVISCPLNVGGTMLTSARHRNLHGVECQAAALHMAAVENGLTLV